VLASTPDYYGIQRHVNPSLNSGYLFILPHKTNSKKDVREMVKYSRG
jgi:hypothetical protein